MKTYTMSMIEAQDFIHLCLMAIFLRETFAFGHFKVVDSARLESELL